MKHLFNLAIAGMVIFLTSVICVMIWPESESFHKDFIGDYLFKYVTVTSDYREKEKAEILDFESLIQLRDSKVEINEEVYYFTGMLSDETELGMRSITYLAKAVHTKEEVQITLHIIEEQFIAISIIGEDNKLSIFQKNRKDV